MSKLPTYFPIIIEIVYSGEYRQVNKPEDLPMDQAFWIRETNVEFSLATWEPVT